MKTTILLPALLVLLGLPSTSGPGVPPATLERESTPALPSLERDTPAPKPGDAVAAPQAAWAAAREVLPAGHWVRRIAFARHGMFVFFSAGADDAVQGQFLDWRDGAWRAEPPEPREAGLFKAAGVPPGTVDRGLARLLQSPAWQAQQGRLLSFTLESHEPRLFWSLLLVPEGGLREGEPLPSVRLPFEPD
jgi:hypothetical protein